MDNGKGLFEKLTQKQVVNMVDTNPGIRNQIFSVGEQIQIKDSVFRIIGIGKGEMRLKLLQSAARRPSTAGEAHR